MRDGDGLWPFLESESGREQVAKPGKACGSRPCILRRCGRAWGAAAGTCTSRRTE